jgi:hypothetical protein
MRRFDSDPRLHFPRHRTASRLTFSSGLRPTFVALITHVIVLSLALPALGQAISSADRAPGTLKPAVVRFGVKLSDAEAALRPLCKKLTTRRIDPPFRVLRDIKHRQMQIDCDGFEFAGAPRWAEFVFADDILVMAWIMTSAQDEKSLLERMIKENGPPDQQNAKFTAFTKGRMALRKDVPEVLFYSERLAPKVLAWFGEKSTF